MSEQKNSKQPWWWQTVVSLPASGNLDAVKWQSYEVQNQLRGEKLRWKPPISAVAYQAGRRIKLRIFFSFWLAYWNLQTSFCRTEAVEGLFFSWLELEHMERAWNLTLPTIRVGLVAWWEFIFIVTLLERNKVARGVTSCPSLLRAEEFPGLGTFREKTKTVPGNPGWLFILKMGWSDPNCGAKELRLQIHKRVSKQQNFKKLSSPMMKNPKLIIHPFT